MPTHWSALAFPISCRTRRWATGQRRPWRAASAARGVRGELPQAGGCLVFAEILHDRRRFPPVRYRAGGLTQVLIHRTEMVQGPAFPVPVASLPKDRKSLLVAVDASSNRPRQHAIYSGHAAQ